MAERLVRHRTVPSAHGQMDPAFKTQRRRTRPKTTAAPGTSVRRRCPQKAAHARPPGRPATFKLGQVARTNVTVSATGGGVHHHRGVRARHRRARVQGVLQRPDSRALRVSPASTLSSDLATAKHAFAEPSSSGAANRPTATTSDAGTTSRRHVDARASTPSKRIVRAEGTQRTSRSRRNKRPPRPPSARARARPAGPRGSGKRAASAATW